MIGKVIGLVGEHTIVVLLNGHVVNGLQMCMFIPVFLTFLVAMIIHPDKSNIGKKSLFWLRVPGPSPAWQGRNRAASRGQLVTLHP